MGPTGSSISMHNNKKILICGEHIANTSLIAISAALQHNNYLTYIYSLADYLKNDIRAVAQQVIPCQDVISELTKLNLNEFDHIIAAGSNKLLQQLKPYNATAHIASPMQCMMKEICGSCLQKHQANGEEFYIFSCRQNWQNTYSLDINNLQSRQEQNKIVKKI